LDGDQPVAKLIPTHRITQTQNKHTQTAIPLVGFETTIPAFERAKTFHALDRAATVNGLKSILDVHLLLLFKSCIDWFLLSCFEKRLEAWAAYYYFHNILAICGAVYSCINSQSGYLVSRPRFDPDISRTQVRSVTNSIPHFFCVCAITTECRQACVSVTLVVSSAHVTYGRKFRHFKFVRFSATYTRASLPLV
jgi:hypothetical protein